jgi:hypothetical protein
MHAERLRAARRYLRCVHEGVYIVWLWPLAAAAAVIVARTLGLYAEVMTVTLHLDDAVAEALAAEAARRGQTADELAAALLAAQLPKAPRRRLTFAAVGASTSGRGAAEADEMLAEGFGRD